MWGRRSFLFAAFLFINLRNGILGNICPQPYEILDGSCLLPEFCTIPLFGTSCPQGYTICSSSNSTSQNGQCCKAQCNFCSSPQTCLFEAEFNASVSNCLDSNKNISSCYDAYLVQKSFVKIEQRCDQVQNEMELWKNQTNYNDNDIQNILRLNNDTRSDLCPSQLNGQCCLKQSINVNFLNRTMSVWPCGVWRSSVLQEPGNFWNFYYYSKFCCCGQGGNGTGSTRTTTRSTNSTITSTIGITNTTIPGTITTNATIFFGSGGTTTVQIGTTNTTLTSTITSNSTLFFTNGTTSTPSTAQSSSTTTDKAEEDILPQYLKPVTSLSYQQLTILRSETGDPSWRICGEDGSKPFEDWLRLAHYSQSQLAQLTQSVFPVITDTQYICTVSFGKANEEEKQLNECFFVPNCDYNDDFFIGFIEEADSLIHPCHLWARATDEYSYLFYDKFCIEDMLDEEDEENGILENDESEEGEEDEERCPPDTIFSLESGLCEEYSLEENQGDDNAYTSDTDYIHCPKGEVYCLDQDICAADCSGDDNEFEEDCPPGTEFCAPLGTCTTNCHYKRSLWINKSSRSADGDDGCSGNRVYCPAIHACSESCDFTHKKDTMDICKEGYVPSIEGGCVPLQKDQQDWMHFSSTDEKSVCSHPGYTYCIESGECVPLDECIEHDSDSNDQCGNGSCQICPRPEEIETNADFSSCIIDGHCDEGQKCCLDQEGFSHCISLNTTTDTEDISTVEEDEESLKNNLQKVCQHYSSTWPDSLAMEDKNCSLPGGENNCPPSALCCNNKCYQLGVKDLEDFQTFKNPCKKQEGTLPCKSISASEEDANEEVCVAIQDFANTCKSPLGWPTAKLIPMPIKERKSVELFENGLPKEFLNSKCFEISYNQQKCNLTIQQEYTKEGDKYCFENNFASKPKVYLNCKANKMGSEKVSITSLEEIDPPQNYNLLLAFGFHIPTLQIGKSKLVLTEGQTMELKNLLDLNYKPKVNTFFAQICKKAWEIGFEKFDIKGDNYTSFLLGHCAWATTGKDYNGHQLSLRLVVNKQRGRRLFQRCPVFVQDQSNGNERSEWARLQPLEQQSANVSALIRGKVTKGSKCKLKLSVTTIYHAQERSHNMLDLKILAGDERPKGRRGTKNSSIKAKLKFPCHETDGLDGIRVGTFAEYFYDDFSCEDCHLCVMYNQVSENGCWQYTTNVNTFECIGNVSGTEKTPVIKAKDDLYDYSCDGKMKLSCFAKNARIRYVRFDTTGKYDKSLPLTNLTQNLLNPIFFVGIKSSNLTQKEDGSLEYNQVCNNVENNTFSDKLGGYYPKPRAKCIRNDKNSQKKNRRVNKYSPKISCDTNTTTITAYKDQCGHCHPKDQKAEKSCEKCIKTECGTCQAETEEECNPKSVLIPSVSIADTEYGLSTIQVNVRCPGKCFETEDEDIDCSLLKDNAVALNASDVKSSHHNIKMTFNNPILDYYKVRCESKLETRTSINSLTVVQSGSIVVQNVSYQEFPDGKVEFVLVLQKPLIGESEASIPELYQCFLQKESSRKITKLKVSSKSNRTVVYCTEQSLPSSQYAIGVVSRSLDKVKPGLRSTSFTYESSKRPQILDAVYRQSLKIIVHFDVKIQCLKESCKAILKAEPAFKDEEGWSCNCVRNKLIISLEENEDLPVEGESLLPQKLIFLENNGVVQKGSNLEGKALPVLQGSNITIRHRESKQLEPKNEKSFKLSGKGVFCHNQPLCFRLRLQKKTLEVEQLQVQMIDDKDETIFSKNITDLKLKQRKQRIRFCLEKDTFKAGKYSLVVSTRTANLHSTTWDFRLASESEELVVEIRAPQKIWANGETILRAISRNCSAVSSKERGDGFKRKRIADATQFTKRRHEDNRPGIYQWNSENEDIDLTDCEKARCPVNGLVGGKTYSFNVTEVIPNEDGSFLETHASKRVSVASRGLKAVIPTSQITVSQEGRIQLTGKLSVDLDLNPNYAMTFDWYCATIHNGSCTIIDSDQTLEEKMGVAEFRKADLDISAEFLPVGQYIFSLNVSKGEKWSETKASVEITLESIPEVRIVALDNMALPGKKFVATALVTAEIGTKVRWESEDCDLSQVSQSFREQFFQTKALNQERFYLIIPPTQKCFNNPDSTYKFCLIAESGKRRNKACTEVKTPEDLNVNGVTLEVNETSLPFVDLTLSREVENALKYYFYLQMPQEKNHQIILGLAHDETTLKDVMLPPGSGLILSAKICSENVCEEIPSITVDVPSRLISEEELRTRLEDIRALLTDEKYLDVISEFQVLLSISKSGENWDQQKNGVCGAFYRGIITAMNDLASQNFTTESIFEANVILDALDVSPCHFDNEVISENRTRALDAATKLLANMDEAKKLQMATNIEKFESGFRQPRKIFKRESSTSPLDFSAILDDLLKKELFDPKNLERKMKIFQNLVTNLSSSDVDRCADLRKKLTFEAALEAAQGITAQDPPVELNIESLSMKITRDYPKVLENMTSLFPDEAYSQVWFNISTLNTIKGTIEDTLETYSIATAALNIDFVTNCSESFNPMGEMKKMLKVFYLDFLDKDPGEEQENATLNNLRTKRSISDSVGTLDINVDLNVPIDDIFADTHLACFLMHQGIWNASFCNVNKVTTTGKYAQVHCNCQNSGFIAVGLVSNADNETVYVEEVFAFKEKLKFKIEENYQDLVQGSEQEFKSSIRSQLMDILDCDPLNIRELFIYPGSIIVEFLLVGADKMEAEQLKQSHAEMVALLASGTLKLEVENATGTTQELKVPKQCVSNCDDTGGVLLRDEEDFALLIIGSCLMGIVFLVLICIIVGVCLKKKKQDEKLNKLAPIRNEMTPSYRAMAFTENMEGTTDSLVKYKRNPTYITSSPMMPLPAAYENNQVRSQSLKSVRLEDAERGQLVNNEANNVPDRARYKEPSQKELISTQTLPEKKMREILEKASNHGSLPGTPQDPH